jgi:hypothetical protein
MGDDGRFAIWFSIDHETQHLEAVNRVISAMGVGRIMRTRTHGIQPRRL